MENKALEGPVVLRLSSEQVTKYWDHIKEVLEDIRPPHEEVSAEGFNAVLEHLLAETAQAWMLTEEGMIKGIIISMVRLEFLLGTRNLYVMAAYSYEGISRELWKQAHHTLNKFASGMQCANIIGFTNVEKIKSVVRMLGGDTSTTLIQLKVED